MMQVSVFLVARNRFTVLCSYLLILLQKNPELRTAQKKLAEQVTLLVHGGTVVSISILL